MKFGVITFPGSNCDKDMVYVLRELMGHQVEELWHKDHDLKESDIIILPGGFSYGDYLRSGAIAKFSPIMTEVIKHAERGGYVLGICNGFQILCESKLLDGALLHNNNQKFICKNTFITPVSKTSGITKNLEQKAYNIPIAHGEGRFFAGNDTIKSLEDNDQILFQYCNEQGEITPESNPNGSIKNIAGISNKNKNVFGMMPHPERAADETLGNTDGKTILETWLKTL